MMSLEEFKELTYKWPFVITAACLYTVTVKYFNTSRPKPAAAFTNTATFKYLCVVHNAALAAYSAWTFISAIPIINQQAWRTDIPIVQRICSADEAVFDNGLDHLTWLFYLSKFYEVLDTAIILAKGKKSPLLQTYHHAGAMLTLFAGSKYKATPIWLFVVFNSFIHSIMYVYYLTAALKLPFPRALKKSLTTMQISQFLVGGGSAAIYFVFRPEDGSMCIPNKEKRFATTLTLAYLTPLTILFMQFFVKEYKRRPLKTAVKQAEQVVNNSLKSRA